MKRVMVRYRVKPDRVAENEEYIRAVFEQLERERPDGLRYVSHKLEDGVTFVHMVWVDSSDDPLQRLTAFKAFTAGIKDRCDEAPIAVRLAEVGSYGFV
jgi:hypothetical protein